MKDGLQYIPVEFDLHKLRVQGLERD